MTELKYPAGNLKKSMLAFIENTLITQMSEDFYNGLFPVIVFLLFCVNLLIVYFYFKVLYKHSLSLCWN